MLMVMGAAVGCFLFFAEREETAGQLRYIGKQTGMLPVASPTNCRKSYPFADEADTFQNDLHNKLHAQKCTAKNEKIA